MKWRAGLTLAALAMLAACGGGGGGGDAGPTPGPTPSPTPTPTPGSAAQLAVSASAIGTAAQGGVVRFDVVVINAGPAAASRATVTLDLGAGLTLSTVACTAAGGAVCPADPASFTVPSLPRGGSLTYRVEARAGAGVSGRVSIGASVSADNDVADADNRSSVAFDFSRSDLSVTGVGPTTVVRGGSARYTMTVSNAGPDGAVDVVLENTVGRGQTLASITCAASAGATCPAALGPTMQVPLLPTQGVLVFTVDATVAPTALGLLGNTLSASAASDTLGANNVATALASLPVAVDPAAPSAVLLQSDAGDYIGGGASFGYDRTNALLTVSATGNLLSISIAGDEGWTGSFLLPGNGTQLQVGSWSGLTRYPFQTAGQGALSWSGEGRGCNMLTGSFAISAVTYVNGNMSLVDLTFEQHCEGGAAALRGQIHWNAADTSQPPGPVNPPPDTLWRPTPGVTPGSGNYLYLQSDAGDYIGAGATTVYTPANATLSVVGGSNLLTVTVNGPGGWSGHFETMNVLTRHEVGYYGQLERWPFNNPTRGGLDWSGNGRGCNTLTGWYVVDSITYVGSAVASIDLRFEQHCEGVTPALRGQLHWIGP